MKGYINYIIAVFSNSTDQANKKYLKVVVFPKAHRWAFYLCLKAAFMKFILLYLVHSFSLVCLALASDSDPKREKAPKITPSSTAQDIANFYEFIQNIKFHYYFDIYDKKLFLELNRILENKIIVPKDRIKNVHQK